MENSFFDAKKAQNNANIIQYTDKYQQFNITHTTLYINLLDHTIRIFWHFIIVFRHHTSPNRKLDLYNKNSDIYILKRNTK